MKLSELKSILDRWREGREDPDVVVAVKLPYATIGRIPTVPIKSIQLGFDWEAGLCIIRTEEELTPADRDFADQMRKMQERAAMSDYVNRNLKAEIRRLQKRLNEK